MDTGNFHITFLCSSKLQLEVGQNRIFSCGHVGQRDVAECIIKMLPDISLPKYKILQYNINFYG